MYVFYIHVYEMYCTYNMCLDLHLSYTSIFCSKFLRKQDIADLILVLTEISISFISTFNG